jgi:filamentous hemagglutinin family protein
MTSSFKNCCEIKGILVLAILVEMAIASIVECALAQSKIEADNTLGNERSVVRQDKIRGIDSDRISGGATRGTNLFHSFREFNISEGRGAYFVNPTGVENILSRVTGNNVSQILGKLGVLGNANLFLMNPNGIIFGTNASLDIRGSFVATTANAIGLGKDGFFSASEPQSSQLLSVKPEVMFSNALARQQATIINRGNLAVRQNLTLAAGNLDLQGQLYAGGNLTLQALETVKIRDSVSAPFVAAAGKQLLVQGNRGVDIFALNHPESGLFSGGDIVLRSANPVGGDAHYWSRGDFRIEQLDGSRGNLFSLYDPIIRSQGDVSFFGYQGTSLHILAGGSVNIDSVAITGSDTVGDTINPTDTPALANVTLSDGTPIVIDGSARPTLDVRSGMKSEAIGTPLGTSGANFPNTQFFNSSFFLVVPPENNPVATSADITIGDIIILPPDGIVLLTNQYEPNSSQPGGDITITGVGAIDVGGIDVSGVGGNGSSAILDSKGKITLAGSFISASSDIGNGGDVKLLANGDITLNPGASIVSDGLLAGKITLMSNADIFVTSGFINSASSSPETGMTGGDIKVIARSLSISGRAELGTLAQGDLGAAKAGNVIIQARESVSLDGMGFLLALFSIVGESGKGNGGNVTIDTKHLTARNGAQISTSTFGQGDAGELTVTAQSMELIGETSDGRFSSGLFTGVAKTAIGDGGNLTIDTKHLLVRDGAEVSLTTKGEGNAGNLLVKAQSIELIGTSADGSATSGLLAQVDPGARGHGGNLTIDTKHLLMRDGARISASTRGEGDAGDLTIAAQSVELIGTSANGLAASGLLALVDSEANRDGGNLTINAENLLVRDGARISVETRGAGRAGDITLKILDNITLTGLDSGIFANTTSSSTGKGGNITINTGDLTIRDRARVTASSEGSGNAGNISQISARNLTLDNGSITTTSLSGNGGNIENIDVQNVLLLRNGSQISTTAGTQESGGGDGGKINLNAGFIIAAPNENNKITANAFEGSGGTINIATNGIFGLAPNRDITASSPFGIDGTVALTILEVDPVSGLAKLPSSTVDRASLIAQDVCTIRDNKIAGGSSFVIIGKGGLPNNPNEPLSNLTGIVEWANPVEEEENTVAWMQNSRSQESSRTIQEAQGWIQNPDGTIALVASAPKVTPQSSNFKIPDCSKTSQTD